MTQAASTLFSLADEHDGVFTVQEAAEAGITRQNLVMLARRGTLGHLSRGIYRLLNYPTNQEKIQLWEAVLWPSVQRSGVAWGTLSHLTALHAHYQPLRFEPAVVDLTIKPGCRVRREQPRWLRLYTAELSDSDITRVDDLPVTTLERTLLDCIAAGVERRLVNSVISAATKDELLSATAIKKIRKMLAI